nr:PREDICTED: hyaluronan mediated motility receptor-like isoform X3 [Megachile rotundata]
MSFSKARIQRFNEQENDVPAPGAYDPKFDSKVKGIVLIEKSERFHDDKSVASAECSLSLCTRSTRTIKPTFRTPQLPRKKSKPRSLIPVQDQKFKYESQHQLADLQVECSNKDKTIQEQEKHIEDMKGEVQKLQLQLEELFKKQTQMEEQHKKDMEAMAELQQEILNGHDEKYQGEVENLRRKLLEASEEKGREIQARKIIESDLKDRIAEFSRRVSVLEKQVDDLKYKHNDEIEQLKVSFENERTILLNEYKLETAQKLEAEVKAKDADELNNFLKEELQNIQRLYKDVSNRLQEAHHQLEESDKKYNLVIKKHTEEVADMMKLHEDEKYQLNHQLEHTKRDYLKEIENLTMARDKEIAELKELTARKIEEETKRVKQHADKMVENAETVTRETLAACRAECNERVKKIIAENDAKVNAMIREAKAAVEEEMRMTAERYKACLVRVETERAALDEKLSQKDAEITRLSITLEQLKSSAETQESFGQSLQMELDRAETELAEKKEELRALKDQIRAEAAEMVARRKRFEIVMAENQASVAALTKRLAQSNAEVERLQHELKRGEDCISEHRDLLTIMRNNSQMVHEQVHTLMEQLDVKKGLVDQLEAESLSEVESLKSLFEAKIDDLKQLATKEVAKLQAECAAKTAENAEIKAQLHEMADHLKEARNMLLKLEETHDAQQIEISRVDLLNTKLSEQLKEREEIVKEHDKLLKEHSEKYEAELNEAKSKIQNLYDKIKNLEERNKDIIYVQDKAGSFKEEQNKLETFEKTIMRELEEERARREFLEVENKKLTEYNEHIMKNYEELNEKYAELVGHHNHRQRIKHLSQLKDKISQLEQDLSIKMRTIEHQQKIIDKLKAEDKRMHIRGKENMLTIPKSATSTPLPSPHKQPLTPLKNRKD